MERRIAVVGSRTFPATKAEYDAMDADERIANAKRCREIVGKFISHLNPVSTVLISGGAKGVDSVAAGAAGSRGIRVVEHLPDWKKYGRSAGFKRNTDIVLDCHDLMAFWDMESRGTLDSLKKARKHHRPFAIVGPDGMLVSSVDDATMKLLKPKRKAMTIPKPRGKRGRRR